MKKIFLSILLMSPNLFSMDIFIEITKSNKLPPLHVMGSRRKAFTLKFSENKILECEKTVAIDNAKKYSATLIEGQIYTSLKDAETYYRRAKKLYEIRQSYYEKSMKVLDALPK